MQRPTLALCMIVKNEAHNLSQLLQSVKGCFDEIHITDTGSTDNTLRFIERINQQVKDGHPVWQGIPEIKVHHFEWVNDFAKARNFSFSHAKTDYIFWMDADDVLSDSKAFIHWRDTVMHAAHYWVAKYNYAYNAKGEVECEFIRERVIKNHYGFAWKYFVHEGLVQTEGRKFWPQRVSTWTLNHMRTEEDRQQDFKRNINLFEANGIETLEPRMKFYYGKELFENGMQKEAGKPLMEAISTKELDIHDRLLATQYAAQSAVFAKAYPQAIDVLMNGLKLCVNRAEYWCLLGDVYLATGQVSEAKMCFESALRCETNDFGGIVVIHGNAYFEHPCNQLAAIHMTKGEFQKAQEYISKLKERGIARASMLEKELERLKDLNTIREGLPKTKDVLISCPPMGAVTDWDENTLKTKGHGGSETAAIEVAKFIKKKTGRPVKIFQPRQRRDVMESGVEYLPSGELVGYLHNIEPFAHISWRHAVPLTKAKSYVWCHDLQCPGAERSQNYDKIVALSGFHKNYLMETNGVPEDKIVLGFNGIDPDNFKTQFEKDPHKIVFSSSPDRGLSQAIDIVKEARKMSGLDLKLHCFYGFENMRKAGQNEWADQLEAKIKENDFVTAHGLVTKEVLMRHFKEAGCWLYPADFIETYCITAIEALCAKTWPIVRDMGALKYTMKEAISKGMCDVLQSEVCDEVSVHEWAEKLMEAIKERKWKKIDIDPNDYSWEKVADFFIEELNLKEGA